MYEICIHSAISFEVGGSLRRIVARTCNTFKYGYISLQHVTDMLWQRSSFMHPPPPPFPLACPLCPLCPSKPPIHLHVPIGAHLLPITTITTRHCQPPFLRFLSVSPFSWISHSPQIPWIPLSSASSGHSLPSFGWAAGCARCNATRFDASLIA